MKIRHLNTEEQNAGLKQIRQAPTDDGVLELSGSRERWPLAGDQLYIDLDLSLANLPAGTLPGHRRGNGRSHLPAHTSCKKFVDRFGMDAMQFVNSPLGKGLCLRGINTRVVETGKIRLGDTIAKQ